MTPSLNDLAWPVHSDRLTIRPATPADAEATWRYRKLPSATQWITTAPTNWAEYLAQFEEPERLAKTLVIEHDALLIGDLMVSIEDAWSQSEVTDQARAVQAELGWCLDPAHQGHGYGTEAVAELIRICFESLQLRRVTANCFADNEPSWRLMERIHMRREMYTIRDALHRSGQWLDGLGYALLADEWRFRAESKPGS